MGKQMNSKAHRFMFVCFFICLIATAFTVTSCGEKPELQTTEIISQKPLNLEKYTGVYRMDAGSPSARVLIKDGELSVEYEEQVIKLIHTEGHKFRMDGGPLDGGIAEFIPDDSGSFSAFEAESYVLTRVEEK